MLLAKGRLLLSTVLPVMLCLSLFTSVKAEATMWTQTYDRDEFDRARSLVATSDGGYALAGTTNSFQMPGDFWLIKTDEFGIVEWNMTYGGPNYEKASLLVETSDGGYALAGTTKFYDLDMNSTTDPWLVKTDAYGNMEWNQTYGEAETDVFSLVATSDGGYALAGAWYGSFDAAGGMSDFWLIKTDEFGNMEWNQTYGEAEAEAATSLIETSDGGYAIAGNLAYSSFGDRDIWLIKTDEFGVVPERAWVILPLLLAATVCIFFCKKKLLHRSQVR